VMAIIEPSNTVTPSAIAFEHLTAFLMVPP
jgi:hypothetical protein